VRSETSEGRGARAAASLSRKRGTGSRHDGALCPFGSIVPHHVCCLSRAYEHKIRREVEKKQMGHYVHFAADTQSCTDR
jgi:hypothetical protein